MFTCFIILSTELCLKFQFRWRRQLPKRVDSRGLRQTITKLVVRLFSAPYDVSAESRVKSCIRLRIASESAWNSVYKYATGNGEFSGYGGVWCVKWRREIAPAAEPLAPGGCRAAPAARSGGSMRGRRWYSPAGGRAAAPRPRRGRVLPRDHPPSPSSLTTWVCIVIQSVYIVIQKL